VNIRAVAEKIQMGPDSQWLKRMGVVGFSFFFIKGILWILVPLLAHMAIF